MKKFFSVNIYLALLVLFLSSYVHAESFSGAYLRLDRQKALEYTGGLTCATTPFANNGTEAAVKITFPNGFLVNVNTNTWTVTTTNIPNNANAWPGIGTASLVSGSVVTFPSGDLLANTTYCFRWNQNSLRNAAVGTNHLALVQTLSAGSAVIDSANVSLNTITNDQLSVTATVPAKPSDLELVFDKNNIRSTWNENDNIIFTIQYKSSIPYATSAIVEASWDKGLLDGSTFNYLDVLEYVTASATNNNDASPVIDILNRKIIWNISNLLPNEEKTLSFKLKVRSDIPTSKKLTGKIKAQGKILNIYGLGHELDFAVQPSYKDQEPANQPTSIPTVISISPTITPTPTLPKSLQIEQVNINEISDIKASLSVNTNIGATYQLQYGTSPNELGNKIVAVQPDTHHIINLDHLTPKTQYFFKVTLNNAKQTVVSDIYTFTTASQSIPILIEKKDIVLSSNRIILTSNTSTFSVIPQLHPLSINVHLDNPENISQVYARFVNSKVLGISTFTPAVAIEETRLVEISPGVYSAEILAPRKKGQYQIQLQIKDNYGGISLRTLPNKIIISSPISIINSQNGKPIEGAYVKISRFEESSRVYIPIDTGISLAYNTDEKGILSIVLPPGQYRFDVTAIGYKTVTKTVVLGIGDYPIFKLIPSHKLIDGINYQVHSFNNIWLFTRMSFENFFTSQITQDVLLLFFIASTIILLTILIIEKFTYRVGNNLWEWFKIIFLTSLLGQLFLMNTFFLIGLWYYRGIDKIMIFILIYCISSFFGILFFRKRWKNEKLRK